MRELAVKSANGTYTESDRAALQGEFHNLGQDIDRIGKNTQYNTIPVFQYDEVPDGAAATAHTITPLASNSETTGLTKQQVVDDTKPGEFNIFYDEVTYDFATTQTPGGQPTDTSFDSGINAGIRDVLKTQIIPNVVEQILDAYPAFGYLNGSSIGIGLNLYSNPSSSVLASVSASVSSSSSQASYTLSVNMATVNLTSPNSRIELEQTIAHEMIHAFMDEAATAGMVGSDRFPLWFVEGMAQTASGPGNWVQATGGLGINAASSITAIQAALQNNSLPSNTNAANYGTGYLACMYLGYRANGGSGAVTAQGIANGLAKIMSEVIDGSSLDAVFTRYTGSNVQDFAAKFATASNNSNAPKFVADLLAATGGGAGGLVSKNLAATDLVADIPKTNVKLFELNTTSDTVKNDYTGTGVTVVSGGGQSKPGVEPVLGYSPIAPAPPTPVTYPDSLFQIYDTVNNKFINPSQLTTDGCYFDSSSGILTIQNSGNYKITGGKGTDGSGNPLFGQIVIAPNVTGVNIDFAGITIDQSAGSGKAAMSIGKGAEVTLNLLDGSTNTLISGTGKAGLEVGEDAALTLKGGAAGTGKLEAKSYSPVGDQRHGSAGIGSSFKGKSGNITIEGGDITAIGSYGGAGIGASDGGHVGNIAISGGTVTAQSPGHGAGIGGGWGIGYGSGTTTNGKITITGGTITAISATHGTGIGAGCGGNSGDITISNAEIEQAIGGDGGAGIGASSSGSCGNIIINSGTIKNATGGTGGAGIGSGTGKCGTITISGGTIEQAKGGDNGAGIGAGKGGQCGKIEVSGGIVTAAGGKNGAGIGAGERGKNNGDIIISGGTVYAEGGSDGTGIGGGRWATAAVGTNIILSGGVITALGQLNPPGHDIGMFTDSEHKTTTAVPVKIGTTTIKAGDEVKGKYDGEGKYNTTGAVDDTGVPIYAYPLDLKNIPPGTAIAPLTVTKIDSVGVVTSKVGNWTGTPPTVLEHKAADGTNTGKSYMWMSGENQTVTITLNDGSTRTLDLIFYPDSGMFRLAAQPLPPPIDKPGNPSNPDPIIKPPPKPELPSPGLPTLPEDKFSVSGRGLILQIGANSHQMMILQQFWLSLRSLGLLNIDISTQEHAQTAIDKVNTAIEQVSGMRSTYGALSNRLDHVIANNENIALNLSQAESRIRDTDMAQEMMRLKLTQIQAQAAQTMLAQANQQPQQVLELLQ